MPNQIAERWSATVVAGGWAAVPRLFMDSYADLNISPTEAMLLLHIMSFKWDNRMPFPSVKKLRTRLGRSDSQVRALLRSLETKGFIRRNTRIGRSNEFDVEPLILALERVAQQQRRENRQARADTETESPPIEGIKY